MNVARADGAAITVLDAETLAMLVTTVTRFVESAYEPHARHERLKAAVPDCRLHWGLLAELGLLALPFSEAEGGMSGSAAAVAEVIRSLARGIVFEPFVEAAVAAGRVLAAKPGEAIARLIGGQDITVLAGWDTRAETGSITAQESERGWQLKGEIRAVPFAAEADHWLIAACATATQEPLVFRLRRTDVPARLRSFRLMDARPAADVIFEGVDLNQTALWLRGNAAEAALNTARLHAASAYCADAVGCMTELLAQTRSYLCTRVQFGAALGTFQALQHRFADMHMLHAEASAVAQALASSLDLTDSAQQHRLCSAAISVVSAAGARIGHEAIQLHGAVGVTDELMVSHYNARLVTLAQLLRKIAPFERAPSTSTAASGLPSHRASLSPVSHGFDEAAFREEVRHFVATQLDPNTRHKVENGIYLDKHDYVHWQQALHRHGWFAAAWPKEFGGRGWSLEKEHVFLQECALNAAPMLIPYGVNMVGPVLYTFGSPAQRERWLPGILSSETWWCQGYSEPNAGSDLAALSTSAVRNGDHYLVNGTKMWTTEAHWADMMHCLVRTQRGARRQEGISFLLIDMRTPGVSIEPIVTLDGVHHTNQVFLDNVHVPAENLVAEEGAGWKIAKFLLARERAFIADTGNKLRMLRQIESTLRRFSQHFSAAERVVQQRRHDHLAGWLDALVELERAYVHEWSAGRDDGVGASVLKVRGTELLQAMTEFWRDSLGDYAACYHAAQRMSGDGLSAAEPWLHAAAVNYAYLYGRCWSIFGGSNEIQRNIIASRLLRT